MQQLKNQVRLGKMGATAQSYKIRKERGAKW